MAEVRGHGFQLLSLQLECALHIEELRRVTERVRGTPGAPHPSELNEPLGAAGPSGLRQANLAALFRDVEDAERLISEAGQQIETLLLQSLRMRVSTMDQVTRAELRRDTADTLDRLQSAVEAQREATTDLIDLLVPERQSTEGLYQRAENREE
jgi:hypothetical protein